MFSNNNIKYDTPAIVSRSHKVYRRVVFYRVETIECRIYLRKKTLQIFIKFGGMKTERSLYIFLLINTCVHAFMCIGIYVNAHGTQSSRLALTSLCMCVRGSAWMRAWGEVECVRLCMCISKSMCMCILEYVLCVYTCCKFACIFVFLCEYFYALTKMCMYCVSVCACVRVCLCVWEPEPWSQCQTRRNSGPDDNWYNHSLRSVYHVMAVRGGRGWDEEALKGQRS